MKPVAASARALTVNGLGSVDKIAASPDVASAIGLTIHSD